MAQTQFSSELESRIQFLENPVNQGRGFSQQDWQWLLLLGVVGPVVLLVVGWFL
jgi:hypothetical protein